MRLKFLLLTLIVSCGIMTAQDTVRSLIITEVSLWRADDGYAELTNMGDSALHLRNFEFCRIDPWTGVTDPTEPFPTSVNNRVMLPDTVLEPGESFVIAVVHDFYEEQYKIQKAKFGYSPDYPEFMNHPDRWEIADLLVHRPEPNGDETDSVSRDGDITWHNVMEVWGGRDTWYILYYLPNGDSVLIDQFNGIFTEEDNTRVDGSMDVAGVTDATNNTILMRKFTIKTGQPDFSLGRGEDLTESEWMPVPRLNFDWPPVQTPFWTMGNHGAYNLDETTLVPSVGDIDINWTDSIITVPWGTRNDDSIMMMMNKTEGLAWHYDYAENHEDSAFVSARTGDIFTVYACGDDLDWVAFNVLVEAPTASENRVVPKMHLDDDGWYDGGYVPYIVTDEHPMDSILDVAFGTRVDTLLKYLEKPANADWEIVWVDGNERTDLMLGDILKVTSENGTAKEYFIDVYAYREDRDAYLSAITWPDIPDYYWDLFGWIGDTVPNFTPTLLDYQVQVPWDVKGIPALVAKTQDLNATMEVTRASNLAGSEADRTTSFTVTAEDDTTILEYNVLLTKQRKLEDIQPWVAEPLFTQVVWQDQWCNDFLEICNPGTEPLDLSNYMLVFVQSNNPATAIQSSTVDTLWYDRYGKYIPGYKWVDSTTWLSNPGFAVQDLNVNALVMPGDVFVIGDIQCSGQSGYPWWASEQCDIDFQNNPWDEEVPSWQALQRWRGYHYYIFKILNDSIHDGLKAANDPNDFELIEHWGASEDDGNWTPDGVGVEQTTGYIRKPEFYLPTLGWPSDSWGSTPDSSQWIKVDRPYFQSLGVGWPDDILLICDGLGSHFMDEVTMYKSTVSSTTYLVDDGYMGDLEIRGVVDNTSVDDFLLNIIEANVDQALTLISATSGNELTGTDLLANGDTLSVLSADSVNTTKYVLEVTAEGLSDNATLTSTTYTITAGDSTGTVSGFPYGTKLETVVDGVTVPDGAAFNIVDQNDAYVPFQQPNFDTLYVDVEVTDQIFFEVISESGEVTILYQLQPDADSSDAFVTSTVYTVDQIKLLIDLLPQGTNVGSFLANLTPSPGATMELIDKKGFTRESGTVVQDDKLVVTAADGETKQVYYISMLPEEEGLKSDYLAYVLSDVYGVDQVTLDIKSDQITTDIDIATFLGNLIPVEGATTTILNASGFEKTSGNLEADDKVQVTAANGVTVAYYTIQVIISSVGDVGENGIMVYPNPSVGNFHISGLEAGNRIRVFNSIGGMLRDVQAFRSEEIISLQNEANGIYFVVISKADSIVGRYKLIKQ